jgi:multidrug resistance efflux pump
LRQDLLQRAETGPKGNAQILKDPASGDFFRLAEVEAFITQQLDGHTSLERIADRIAAQYGEAPSIEELEAFAQKLDSRGLLENKRGAKARERVKRGRMRGGLLLARFKLLDPDRLLDRLLPRVRFFYTPAFFYFSLATIALALWIAVLDWSMFSQDAHDLTRLSTLPLLIITLFFTISVHELSHGMTCKHFGGHVRDMGFMLMYLQPAFYCNVSDAWLFPEKSKRLWVTFAGPYFELFIWAFALLVWRVTEPGIALHEACVVVVASSGIKTLLNLNPLIKLDGYYLLSDYLDMPNLRKRSFAYLGEVLRHPWRPPGRLSRRERRIYLTYGTTAWVGSFAIMLAAGITIAQYLISAGQTAAFFALSVLYGVKFRAKFRRLRARKPAAPRPVEHPQKDNPPDADEHRGPDEHRDRDRHRDPAKHRDSAKHRDAEKRRLPWRRALTWLTRAAVAAALGALLVFGHLQLRVAGPIRILPEHNADVRAEIAGIIDEIYVEEGQHVSKGDPIAKLDDREYRAELDKITAQIRQDRAKLNQLKAGPTREQLDLARQTVVAAEDKLRFATAKRERSEELFERQLVSNQDYDQAREAETAARNDVAGATAQLELLQAGARPEEIEAAEAELATLEAQQRFLQGQLERVDVLSPADGIITTPHLDDLVGQAVPAGGQIADVHDLEQIIVEATISEKEIADVEVGQRVAVKTRAYPDRAFYGTVTAIATTAGATGTTSTTADPAPATTAADPARATSIRVITRIDNKEGFLKPGMTGMAKIDCGDRRVLDLITRRLSRSFRVEFWSWW